MTQQQPDQDLDLSVSYFGLAQVAVGHSQESIRLTMGASVAEAVFALLGVHGAPLREVLIVGDDQLVPNATVLIDGRDVRHHGGLTMRLTRSCAMQIVVLPPASGGG